MSVSHQNKNTQGKVEKYKRQIRKIQVFKTSGAEIQAGSEFSASCPEPGKLHCYLFSKQNVKVNCDDDDGDDDDDHDDYDNGGGKKLTDLFGTHMVNSQ